MSGWRRPVAGILIASPAILLSAALAATTLAPGGADPAPTARMLAQAESAAEDAAATDAASGDAAADEGPAEFTEAFLNDQANIEAGKVVWEVCAGCHGSKAYPGKAPKLRPKRYEPAFVFDRVTNGYKKMPPWKDVFTKEERMQVVAWILSDHFVP